MRFLRFSRKRQDGSAQKFFQDLVENTCSLQPALKSNAPTRPLTSFSVIDGMLKPLANVRKQSH